MRWGRWERMAGQASRTRGARRGKIAHSGLEHGDDLGVLGEGRWTVDQL